MASGHEPQMHADGAGLEVQNESSTIMNRRFRVSSRRLRRHLARPLAVNSSYHRGHRGTQRKARKWGQRDRGWIFLTPSFCPFLQDDDHSAAELQPKQPSSCNEVPSRHAPSALKTLTVCGHTCDFKRPRLDWEPVFLLTPADTWKRRGVNRRWTQIKKHQSHLMASSRRQLTLHLSAFVRAQRLPMILDFLSSSVSLCDLCAEKN